jgi:hypothetical protein
MPVWREALWLVDGRQLNGVKCIKIINAAPWCDSPWGQTEQTNKMGQTHSTWRPYPGANRTTNACAVVSERRVCVSRRLNRLSHWLKYGKERGGPRFSLYVLCGSFTGINFKLCWIFGGCVKMRATDLSPFIPPTRMVMRCVWNVTKRYVRFEVSTAVTRKNVVFWEIKPQFVLHRRHITSPLQRPAS